MLDYKLPDQIRHRALDTREYWPGLVTAVALNLPFSIYLFTRARREGWCSPRAAIALVPAALFAHGALLAGVLFFM